MQSFGQTSTQCPQSMHSFSFTTATLSTVIAPTGHSSAHNPHATQHPSSIFAGMREYAIVIFIDIALSGCGTKIETTGCYSCFWLL